MRPTSRRTRMLSVLLREFPEARYRSLRRDGSLSSTLRPRYWLYIYFRFYRQGDGKLISGCRPFSNARQALRFISQYAGKNLIDDVYFVDSKERKVFDVYCDYNNIKLLPLQASFDFENE